MSSQTPSQGKGKAKGDFVDLTVDEPSSCSKAIQAQLPSPISPPGDARPAASTQTVTPRAERSSSGLAAFSSPARAGPSSFIPSSSACSPTQGTKRKVQQARLTEFYPLKKARKHAVPPSLTPDEKKAVREAEKAAKEKERLERLARAEAKRLAKERQREERDAKKAEEDAVKAARAEERRLKKEARDAEAARKREIAQWKVDWKDWVQRNRQPEAEFRLPIDEDMWENHMNIKDTKLFGLTRNELDCLQHCDVKNPAQPPGEEYAPMKIYRIIDVNRLAWRKEGIVNGVAQDDDEALLREGARRLETRMEKEDGEQGE